MKAVSASEDDTVRVWDLVTRKSEKLSGHMSAVRALAFSPDGYRLYTGARDKVINVWNLRDSPGTQWFLPAASLVKTLPIYETIEGLFVLPSSVVEAMPKKMMQQREYRDEKDLGNEESEKGP